MDTDPQQTLTIFLPCLFGAEHLGPDQVCINGLLLGVGGTDLEGQRFAGGPCQCGQALNGPTSLQSEVRSVQLGQGFFNQRHPELLPLGLMVNGKLGPDLRLRPLMSQNSLT